MAGDYCAIGNGTKPNPLMGDPVRVGFSSTMSSTGAFPLVIFDDDGIVRVLKSFERLILDSLIGDISAGSVDITNGSSTVASSTLLASFNTAVGLWTDGKEGAALPTGKMPQVVINSTSSTATVKISGAARIVEGTTQGVRPAWREATVRGD